jgi:hypothetical protein
MVKTQEQTFITDTDKKNDKEAPSQKDIIAAILKENRKRDKAEETRRRKLIEQQKLNEELERRDKGFEAHLNGIGNLTVEWILNTARFDTRTYSNWLDERSTPRPKPFLIGEEIPEETWRHNCSEYTGCCVYCNPSSPSEKLHSMKQMLITRMKNLTQSDVTTANTYYDMNHKGCLQGNLFKFMFSMPQDDLEIKWNSSEKYAGFNGTDQSILGEIDRDLSSIHQQYINGFHSSERFGNMIRHAVDVMERLL